MRFENDDPLSSDMGDLDFILMALVQNEYLKESSDLSEMIQGQFAKDIDIPNRGIDQAGFHVLNRAYRPAERVETAFNDYERGEKPCAT